MLMPIPLSKQQAVVEIQKVLDVFQCAANVTVQDVDITESYVIVGHQSSTFASALFDFMFPPAPSGVYYHYSPFPTFQAIASSGKLRFFSSAKKDSIGEFLPFCADYNLDGYTNFGPSGTAGDMALELMDNLFCKSFVASPTEAADDLWDTFADHHTGTRLKFEIQLDSSFRDFRHMAYQDSTVVPIVKALQGAFTPYDWKFAPLGLSRMGGYYQLVTFNLHKECRLLRKRIPGDTTFQFHVSQDSCQKCNYIDYDLITDTCPPFELRLTEVVPGCKRSLQEVQDFVNNQSVIPGLLVKPL